MDVRFVLNGIHFEWNASKARQNAKNHDGVTFEQATEAFFDPFVRVIDASRNDGERDAIIGMDRAMNLLFVVHIEFHSEIIRIISARKATREERKTYEI